MEASSSVVVAGEEQRWLDSYYIHTVAEMVPEHMGLKLTYCSQVVADAHTLHNG